MKRKSLRSLTKLAQNAKKRESDVDERIVLRCYGLAFGRTRMSGWRVLPAAPLARYSSTASSVVHAWPSALPLIVYAPPAPVGWTRG